MAREPGLAIGIEPAFADFTARSDLTPEFIRHYIIRRSSICGC